MIYRRLSSFCPSLPNPVSRTAFSFTESQLSRSDQRSQWLLIISYKQSLGSAQRYGLQLNLWCTGTRIAKTNEICWCSKTTDHMFGYNQGSLRPRCLVIQTLTPKLTNYPGFMFWEVVELWEMCIWSWLIKKRIWQMKMSRMDLLYKGGHTVFKPSDFYTFTTCSMMCFLHWVYTFTLDFFLGKCRRVPAG